MALSRAKNNENSIRFSVLLPPVTKKNSQRIVKCGNRMMIMPSTTYKRYERDAGFFLRGSIGRQIAEPVTVKCLFYMATRRRVDLNNLLEAATDMLVHHGVLHDDNSSIVCSHDGSRVLYDPENPRTEIEITEYAGERM